MGEIRSGGVPEGCEEPAEDTESLRTEGDGIQREQGNTAGNKEGVAKYSQ